MKYQHILNKVILFETNDASEFMLYLMNDKQAVQAKYSVFYKLLEQSNGYICEMVSAQNSIKNIQI